MDGPESLGIPGDDLPRVSHCFRRAHDRFCKRLLIVAGRNSAVEAALRYWRAGAKVTISYRWAQFDVHSVERHILPDLRTRIQKGTTEYHPQTVPTEIVPTHVILAPVKEGRSGKERPIAETGFVLLCTGFVQDLILYEAAG
jgi:thioredoxin reductase (NADPH)